MPNQELKTFTVNMKSLGQDIDDPIVQGGGDANGRTFKIIFTQEAADMFTPDTKVYLKWRHQQLDVRGYNVFTHVQGDGSCCFEPPVWEIHWPKAMLHEGDVLCRIEVVDEISIAPSTNFIVHVLADPDDGSNFVVSDDYTIFQQAIVDMNSAAEKAEQQLKEQAEEFDGMRQEFSSMKQDVSVALDKANQAFDMAQEALDQIGEKTTATGVYMNEY